MRALDRTAFTDRETLEALRGDPDLLAIADAVVATQRGRRRHWSGRLARVGVAAAAIVIAAAVALAVPWPGRGSGFVARALAALGDGQVIHVISFGPVPGRSVLNLQTGAESPVQTQTEIWFDRERGLERVLASTGGQVSLDELETPLGAWTQSGPVYTCAWIAAHPVEATKAGVSCNQSGENGTAPRQIPEPRPSLDPALTGFVSGYREALANGSAERDGSGAVDGRSVEWLRFAEQPQSPAGSPSGSRVERVAVDTQTLKPVLVETLIDGKAVGDVRISTIETLDPQGVNFSRPKQAARGQTPTATSVTSQQTVTLADAAVVLNGTLLWAGQSIDGLPLGQATQQQIVIGYAADSGVPDSHAAGVELVYGGPADPLSNTDYVVLKESLQPQLLYGFAGPDRQAPAGGSMFVSSSDVVAAPPGSTQAVPTGATIWQGQLEQNGVYVTIETTSKALLVHAAHALSTLQTK